MSITGAFIVPHPPIVLPEVGRGREENSKMLTPSTVTLRIAEIEPEVIIITASQRYIQIIFTFHPVKANDTTIGVSSTIEVT